MNIAQTIKNQIDNYYENNYINHVDLSNHLKQNRIDSFEPTHMHVGYEKPCSEAYPSVFYYEDDSMLVVTGTTIFSAKKD